MGISVRVSSRVYETCMRSLLIYTTVLYIWVFIIQAERKFDSAGMRTTSFCARRMRERDDCKWCENNNEVLLCTNTSGLCWDVFMNVVIMYRWLVVWKFTRRWLLTYRTYNWTTTFFVDSVPPVLVFYICACFWVCNPFVMALFYPSPSFPLLILCSFNAQALIGG